VWFFPLLNEKAELLPVAPKKKRSARELKLQIFIQKKLKIADTSLVDCVAKSRYADLLSQTSFISSK
jgi:hypothetical protein